MSLKRTKAKFYNLRSNLFLSIGLCLSLLFIISAFEWEFYNDGSVIELGNVNTDFENIVEVPPTEQPPAPAPKIVQPKIIEVSNEEDVIEDIVIDLDIEMTEDLAIEKVIETEIGEVEEEDTEEIFVIVEDAPVPKGGMAAFYQHVNDNIKYPRQAQTLSIEGKVFVQFVVGKDGGLTDIKVIRGIGGGCDEEAVRVVKLSPKWKAGKQRGRPVRVKMVLPITFKIL